MIQKIARGIAPYAAALQISCSAQAIPTAPSPQAYSTAPIGQALGGSDSDEAFSPVRSGPYFPPITPPVGILEAAGCPEKRSPDGRVSGWAIDEDSPKKALDLHIYMDGPAGSEEGRIVATARTGKTRRDIGYNAGFEVPMPLALQDGKAHALFVYALGVNYKGNQDGVNALLHDAVPYKIPKTIVCAP